MKSFEILMMIFGVLIGFTQGGPALINGDYVTIILLLLGLTALAALTELYDYIQISRKLKEEYIECRRKIETFRYEGTLHE